MVYQVDNFFYYEVLGFCLCCYSLAELIKQMNNVYQIDITNLLN